MGGVEALRLIRQFSIDMPVIAITASVDDAQLQYLMDEGFSMVTTKPLRVSTCRELLAKYGHIFLPLNPGSKHQPATKSPRGSQETTQTSSWVEDMSKGASSAVAARHDPVASTSLAIVDPSARTPATAELAVHSVPRDFRAKRGRGQPSVLIVMHNTTERLLLKAVCQLEGCVVHTSETGVNALKTLAANEGTYTLCLVDTVLPDVEPHSFCSQMLELVRGGAAINVSDLGEGATEGHGGVAAKLETNNSSTGRCHSLNAKHLCQ
jgi:CheY-like chemotaxis protein